MHPDLEVLAQRERRREEMAQAAHFQLVRLAEQAQKQPRVGQPVIGSLAIRKLKLALANRAFGLGNKLVIWGWHLRVQAEPPARNER